MNETVSNIAQVVVSLAIAVVAVWYIWRLVGGWRAFRNPWVSGPFMVALVSIAVFLAEALHQDRIREGNAPPGSHVFPGLGVGGFIASLSVSLGWGMLAGVRRRRRITQILRLPKGNELYDPFAQTPPWTWRELAESQSRLDDLQLLLPLIAKTGGAPGFSWLTPEWVRAQIAKKQLEAVSSRPSSSYVGDGVNR